MKKPKVQCKRCLYTTAHPLGLVLDEHGICSGCRVHEEKESLDWQSRWNDLELLVEPYRGRDPRNYDCIVPVTGAGDSFYTVYLVKEKLGLNPLLVTHNRHYNTPLGIRNLAQLRRVFNCDLLIQTVNPVSVKKIIRSTLRSLNSIQWPAIAGQTCFPVQTAISHKIPLIIWGAHQGTEQVGMFSHLNNVEMTRRYRKEHDLMGMEADDLISAFDLLKEEDIWQYRYPLQSDIAAVGVRGIYLSNYVRWDPLFQHDLMTRKAGYHSCSQPRTFDVHDHVDDWHYMGLHDYLKYAKHGYGKVLDHACREIRHGRIEKATGIMLVSEYSHQTPENLDLFREWLGMSERGLWMIIKSIGSIKDLDYVEKSRSDKSLSNKMSLKNHFGDMLRYHSTYSRGERRRHVLFGKGYPD